MKYLNVGPKTKIFSWCFPDFDEQSELPASDRLSYWHLEQTNIQNTLKPVITENKAKIKDGNVGSFCTCTLFRFVWHKSSPWKKKE